ncbi:Nitric oxide reductase subunit C [compost metagenome]
MLTKSQARAFFVGGTALFSAIFLGLTVDTLRQVPKQTNEHKMTAQVVHGKEIWEANNCMGCHTLFGEGAYYAPELTKVYERRGPVWMTTFLKDPQAMYPGERKMVKYNFTDKQIDDLIAFFQWAGEVDLNGFPKKPDLGAPAQAASTTTSSAVAAQPAYFAAVCAGCHTVAGKGGNVGPVLDGVGTRMTAEQLDAFIRDPQKIRPGTKMPNLGLDDTTRGELVTYLTGLR